MRNLPAKDSVSYSDRDSDGNKLSEGQQEFFKDSKVRDADGNLLKVYHNTNEEFTVFNGEGHSNFNSESVANWFTDNERIGRTYAPYGNTMELYVNLTNPLVIDAKGKRFNAVQYHGHKGTSDIVKMAKKRGYDGVIFNNIKDYSYLYSDLGTSTVIATFDSNQSKLTTNLNPTENEDIRYSDRTFSYDELSKKPDIVAVPINPTKYVKFNPDGTIDSKHIRDIVKKNTKTLTKKGGITVHYVTVPDISTDVEITRGGIEHGYHGGIGGGKKPSPSDLINARVELELPNVLASSIEVNRLKSRNPNTTDYSSVLIGLAELQDVNGNSEIYVVRSVVERKNGTSELAEYGVLGKLYAMNAKKATSVQVQPLPNGNNLPSGRSLSFKITDILKESKTFADTFSNDVYKHFGMRRVQSEFSRDLMFQDRDPNALDNRTLLANALESAAQNDIEKSKIASYKKNIESLNEEEKKLAGLKAQIKELSFAKGHRDSNKIRALQDEATKTARCFVLVIICSTKREQGRTEMFVLVFALLRK